MTRERFFSLIFHWVNTQFGPRTAKDIQKQNTLRSRPMRRHRSISVSGNFSITLGSPKKSCRAQYANVSRSSAQKKSRPCGRGRQARSNQPFFVCLPVIQAQRQKK